MKILILASWYPNDGDKVYGIFIKEQAKALFQNGVDVRVFYPFDKSLKNSSIISGVEDGIITYRCNTDYLKNSKISRINSALKTIKGINNIRKEYKFDIIHCHVCYFSGIIGYLYKKLFNVNYLITEHMSYIGDYAEKSYNYFLLKRAYKSAEKVICVSNYLVQKLEDLGFKFNAQVIGNVVDLSLFNIHEDVVKRKDECNILFIGSMDNDEVKGVDLLLKAFARLYEENPNCKLHLIGDGIKRSLYEKLASDLGIGGKCKFYGKMNKPYVAMMLNSADFFVLPSRYETFGTVIIEALASGKPVLTTDRGAQKEIINDCSYGYLAKSEDVNSLYQGLKYMTVNYEKYDIFHLREHAMQYSYENIANQLSKAYKNII